jgi:hypothetical protein
MQEIDPGVRLKIVRDLPHTWLRPDVWSRPTLSVGLRRLRMFRPLRGPVFQCWPYTKISEYRRLEAAGIPVPEWRILGPRSKPDILSLGQVVVVKPAAGGGSSGVRLMRSNEVEYQRPTNRGARHCPDLIVQRFVYTGQRPIYYKVLTFFGQVLSALSLDSNESQAPLPRLDELGDSNVAFDPAGVYPSYETRKRRLLYDSDIIEFAERAHRAAFADLPMLGVDIIREHGTGKLFILEVNAFGTTWHFSTRSGRKTQEKLGFRYETQFNAFHRAARILVEQARSRAW